MPRKAEYDERAFAALVRKQHGVISREQALSAGMNRWAIERMHERGLEGRGVRGEPRLAVRQQTFAAAAAA